MFGMAVCDTPTHELIAELLRRGVAAGRIVMDREVFAGGVRYSPGAYQLAYLGPAESSKSETD